jgi:hypothetical protein
VLRGIMGSSMQKLPDRWLGSGIEERYIDKAAEPGPLPSHSCSSLRYPWRLGWRAGSPQRRWPNISIPSSSIQCCQLPRRLIARDATTASVESETALSSIMSIFARGVSGKTSVGLNAVAVVKERNR